MPSHDKNTLISLNLGVVMEFNTSPLGSLLTATDAQFVSLYQQRTMNNQNEFVESYKSLQTEAYTDFQEVRKYAIRPMDLGCKINKIVKVAKNAYLNSVDNTTNLTYVQQEAQVFRVFVYEPNKNPSSCMFCSHSILEEASFEIENMQNHANIKLSELEIHEIKNHEYFSKDALTICKVLGITTTK